MTIAFTGTRLGMTPSQREVFRRLLESIKPNIFLHGDCVGADSDAHFIAANLGICIEKYPCNLSKQRAYCKAGYMHPPMPPIKRNRMMVDRADVVIAAPSSTEEQLRSGTWATIRYARKRGKSLEILYP